MRSIFCFFLLSCFFNGSALCQFKNIILAKQDHSERSVGSSITINLENKDNIVGIVGPDKLYMTKDGGQTWTKVGMTSSYALLGNPVVTSDRKGDFYFLQSGSTESNEQNKPLLDRILCQKSTDGGESWKQESLVSYSPPKPQYKARAVADLNSSRIYAAWVEVDASGDAIRSSNIFLSESKGGKRWSDPISINQISGDNVVDIHSVKGAIPAVGSDGQLYVAWSYKNQIHMNRSLDGKNWLRNSIRVTEQAGGSSLQVHGVGEINSTPVLIGDNSESQYNGMLYLNWADQRRGKNDTDIWFIKSANSGDTWTSPVKVNDDEPGKHQFLSAMTMDNTTGIIYIVYYDRRNYDDLQTEVYLSYSTDGGNSFTNEKISETPFISDEAYALEINISAHEGRIVPIWKRVDDGRVSTVTAVIEQEELAGLKTAAK